MNEPSIWTVIHFNKLINTAHALDWMHMCHSPYLNNLISFIFHPRTHFDAGVFSFKAPATPWFTALCYFYTDYQSLVCSTCSRFIQSKYTVFGCTPSAKYGSCKPLEFNLPLKIVHKLQAGYSKATVNSCGSDISKRPKPIKANWIKVIQ